VCVLKSVRVRVRVPVHVDWLALAFFLLLERGTAMDNRPNPHKRGHPHWHAVQDTRTHTPHVWPRVRTHIHNEKGSSDLAPCTEIDDEPFFAHLRCTQVYEKLRITVVLCNTSCIIRHSLVGCEIIRR
jgi:hypothetical protein